MITRNPTIDPQVLTRSVTTIEVTARPHHARPTARPRGGARMGMLLALASAAAVFGFILALIILVRL